MWRILVCAILGLAQTVAAGEFTVQVLSNAPPPASEIVLQLASDRLPRMAYYATGGSIVYGQLVGTEFQFQVVDTVAAPTEVALAIGPLDVPYLAYGDGTIQIAHLEPTDWVIDSLAEPAENLSLDLEFARNGVLALAHSQGSNLRLVALQGSTLSRVFVGSGAPSSIDLEFDSQNNARIAFWRSVSGNVTDLEWGATYYSQCSASTWSGGVVEAAVWARSPALSLTSQNETVLTVCRLNGGQELLTRFVYPSGYVEWRSRPIEPTTSVPPHRTSAGLAYVADGRVQVLARQTFHQQLYGVLSKTDVPLAERVGRESMATSALGVVHAAYPSAGELHYATFDPSRVPAPTITSFTGPTWSYQFLPMRLDWSSQDADGVSLAPTSFIGPANGFYEAPLNGKTTFTLRAVSLGGIATATKVVDVKPSPPIIEQWSASSTEITATEEITLSFHCQFASQIRITPPGYESASTQDSYKVRVNETTTFVLTATGTGGSTSQSVTVSVVRPFKILSLLASQGTIGRADEVELSWNVLGYADLRLDSFHDLPHEGSVVVVPGESRDYWLFGEWQGYLDSAVVHVEVDDSFLNSRFYLSYSTESIEASPPDLSLYMPFTVYVLGLSLDGGGIAGMEFGLDIPPGLLLASVDLHSARAVNVTEPPDFIVGLGQCYEIVDLQLLATLQFIAIDQGTIDQGKIRLRPAIVQSIPGRVAYANCAPDLYGSEIGGPLTPALIGPPLYLSPRGVPILELSFSAERSESRVRLQWKSLSLELVNRLELARSFDAHSWESIATWRGADIARQSSWEDATGQPSVQYRLSALLGDLLVVEEIIQVEGQSIPVRTRLLAAAPNPFNPSTTIQWEAAQAGDFELRIVNAAGRIVRAIPLRAARPGRLEQDWDGLDGSGQRVSSGVYFAQLSGAGAFDQMRLVLLK